MWFGVSRQARPLRPLPKHTSPHCQVDAVLVALRPGPAAPPPATTAALLTVLLAEQPGGAVAAVEVAQLAPLPDDAVQQAGGEAEVCPEQVGEEARGLWRRAVALAAEAPLTAAPPEPGAGGGEPPLRASNVLLLADAATHAALLWAALDHSHARAGAGPGADGAGASMCSPVLRVSPGGMSLLEWSGDPSAVPPAVKTLNNTAFVAL
jgi:hypothetical protein